MQTISLILLPWIVYGIMSLLGWWNTGIIIAIAFIAEVIYGFILYFVDLLFSGEEEEQETALQRAKRVIG